MELDEFIDDLITGVDGDSTITNYCELHLTRDLTVKDSPPPGGLPGEDDCPCLFLTEDAKGAGSEKSQIKYFIGFGLCLYGASLETRADDAEVQAMAKHLRKLSVLIKNAIVTAKPASFAMSYDITHDFVSLFPLFVGQLNFEFTEHARIGVNPMND